MKACPLFNGIIVKKMKEDQILKLDGGLHVHNPNLKRRIIKAKVVKVGHGVHTEDRSRIKIVVQEGDVILYEETSCLPIMLEGGDYGLLPENRILIVLYDKDGNSIEDREGFR